MTIIEKALNEITPYENNPRNNAPAVDAVAASIEEFGFKVPIVIDKDGVIVAGHTRYIAAQKLGLETVPCIMADDLSDEQVKAFRLADNKVSELADWDFSKLEEELSEIEDIDMSDFGFDPIEEEERGEIEMLDIDESEGTTRHTGKILNIDGQKIIMTDEECAAILDKLEKYLELNGVSFGFVGCLLNGEI